MSQILQKEYEDVAIDHRLHPDDDFEQILDRVVDRLAQDYGHTMDEADAVQTFDETTVAGGMAPVQGSLEEGNLELDKDTLDLIDEYIAKFEPGADRDEIIQNIIKGNIHPSELEYALSEQATQDPINYNAAITGSYYESEDPLARIKTLALPKQS